MTGSSPGDGDTPRTDDEALTQARAFRPKKAPLVVALVLNLALALAFLGYPYLRGRQRGGEAAERFADFAACLFGGAPAEAPGLALPAGSRKGFATRFLRAEPDWPGRCDHTLQRVAPEEALLLWPSVKQAEAEVRAAVRLVARELDKAKAVRKRGAETVPSRPLRALGKLRGALSQLAEASGNDLRRDADAIALDTSSTLVTPTAIPLSVGPGAALDMWLDDEQLDVTALGTGAVAWVRVASGRLERQRFKRSQLVRGLVRPGEQPYVVWATPEERCAERDDGCRTLATGIARLDLAAKSPPEPVWLASHVPGRPDRNVVVSENQRVTLLARASADGALARRVFDLRGAEAERERDREGEDEREREGEREGTGEGEDGEPAPLRPVEDRPLAPPGVHDVLLLDDGRALVASTSGDQIAFTLVGGPSEPLAQLPGQQAWILRCSRERDTWLALGTDRRVALGVIAGDPWRPVAELSPPDMDRPLHPQSLHEDNAKLACDARGASLVLRATEGTLHAWSCLTDQCSPDRRLTEQAHGFDVARHGGDTLVAYARQPDGPIYLTGLAAGGTPLPEELAPAACWSPRTGMCGTPVLTAGDDRIVLTAHDRGNALALQTSAPGEPWLAMQGIENRPTPGYDASSSAMEAHRERTR